MMALLKAKTGSSGASSNMCWEFVEVGVETHAKIAFLAFYVVYEFLTGHDMILLVMN